MLTFYLSLIPEPEQEDKFSDVYYTYRDQMFHIINSILNNYHDSEDALQISFVYIAKHIHDPPEASSPLTKGYVFKTAENTALNMKKRVVKRHEHDNIDDFSDIPSADDLEKTVENRDATFRVFTYIKLLPEYYQTVIYLHVLHNYSAREIAEFQGIKYNTAKTRLNRAIKMLRKIAKENGYDE